MSKLSKQHCLRRTLKKLGGWFCFMTCSRQRARLTLLTVFACLMFVYVAMVQVAQEHMQILLKAVRFKDSTWVTVWPDPEPGNYCGSLRRQRQKTGAGESFDFLMRAKNYEGQVCIHPELNPCDPSISAYDAAVPKLNCSEEENWVYVDNGTFRISARARRKYGKITCEYAPIVRGRGDYTARHAEHIKPMPDGSPLVSDFFKVACISPSGKRYHNIHAGVAYNKALHARSQETPLPDSALGYDVFMFGFDSTSRMSWLRNLPKTRDFFLRELGGIELEGYNIVGDGTVQALLPILTGNMEADLPTARRGDPRARELDDYPWIWKPFKEAGYITSWAEDMSYIGTFQMRLHGFREQPTDHSMRTYFLMAEPMYQKFKDWCAGSEARHMRFLNWFRDMYYMYEKKPKFMFGFHSELSHGDSNSLKMADEDLYDFFKHLHSSGYLNHTILILMGDHGSRFSKFRSTPQGKLEERLPYFAFSFPPSFVQSHPKAVENFKINTHRLTTPFDVHETFHAILNFHEKKMDHTKGRGISLFKEVPKNRSCADAGVEAHWCACLQWTPIADENMQRSVANAVINFFNNLTSPVHDKCALLELERILSLSRFSPNSQVLKFKGSADKHGDVPDLSDDMTLPYDYYQVSLMTKPGHGIFEVTVKHSVSTNEYRISEEEISRTNRYGDAPACIAKVFPNLRPYCYCLS